MGTNTNQIASRYDIDSGKRKNAYSYSRMNQFTETYKCPTKGEINQIEFLDVKNSMSTVNETTYWDVGKAYWNSYGSMKIGPNNTSVNSNNTTGSPIIPATYKNYPMIIPDPSTRYYHSSTSQLFNISFNAGIDDIDFNDFNNIEANALCYKTISTTPGKLTSLRIHYNVIAYAHTSSPKSNYSFSNVVMPKYDEKQFGITIAIVDSNSEVIYLTNIDNYVGTSSYNDINFTPTTSSAIIYIIPRYIDASFYPIVSGNLYVGVGFELSIRKIIYNSYYDDDRKLAQYKDIGTDSVRQFDIYFGVWNNKSTKARVNYARAMINTTTDGTTSGWTQIGQVTLSDIAANGTKTGTITCTLPSNIDLGAQQYYLLIKVGDTLNKQDFNGGWGSTASGTSYTYCRKSTSGWTPSIPLTPTSVEDDEVRDDAVLNTIDIIGESEIVVKGAYNANPELKGWIKIT